VKQQERRRASVAASMGTGFVAAEGMGCRAAVFEDDLSFLREYHFAR